MLDLNIFQKEDEWAKELAQPLRVLAALDEDLASIPSTHMSAHKLYISSPGHLTPLLTSADTRHTHT